MLYIKREIKNRKGQVKYMKKLLEEQIRNINSELELVESVEKKIELRLSFAMLLHDLDGELELPEISEGKDAIKSDSKKKKKTTKKKEEPAVAEEVVEETKIEESFNDEELQNTGIELQEEMSEEPSPVKTEIIIEGVDCTDTYNRLPYDMDEELHQSLAYVLEANKEIIPVYEEIVQETGLSHSEYLINLAYLLYTNDLEAVNGALAEFSNGVLKDVYTDLNDNNLEAFMNYIDSGEEE